MKIKVKNKVIDAIECRTAFSKFRGLMFRKKPEPLLFIFEKPTRQSIHSLFCKPFVAFWLLNGEIVDEKFVEPFSLSISPKGKYTHLVEIPIK
jgi:uncharacterized membrane protein (UPF0127 family)